MSKAVSGTLASAVLLAVGIVIGVAGDRLWHAQTGKDLPHEAPPTGTGTPATEDEEPEPAAVVRTVVAAAGVLHSRLEAVGVAAVPPTATAIEFFPTDVVVTRVLVQPGELVSRDSPLAQVSVTRDVETQVAAAQLAFDNASKSLDLSRERLDRGLATRTDLAAAQATRDEAKQRLDRLQAGLPPPDGVLRAHSPGIVGTVRIQAGANVPAGTPVLDITSDAVVAQIGIDPALQSAIAVGQVFEVRPIDDRAAERWKGIVSLMAHSVNPTTRLIDTTLVLSGDALPRPGTPLRSSVELDGKQGVIIPRAALVPDGDEMVVFVVREGTAKRTSVTIAQRGDDRVALASGCEAGDHVVISGQSQLTQGATVREVAAEPKPARSDGGAGANH